MTFKYWSPRFHQIGEFEESFVKPSQEDPSIEGATNDEGSVDETNSTSGEIPYVRQVQKWRRETGDGAAWA